MSYDNLRNLVNENYDLLFLLLRPIFLTALNSAINVAEQNDEDVADQLLDLINAFVDDDRAAEEAIQTYLSSINRNSATRHFFEFDEVVPPPQQRVLYDGVHFQIPYDGVHIQIPGRILVHPNREDNRNQEDNNEGEDEVEYQEAQEDRW